MYVLIVSDAPALPVDLCIASAMLGHAAWAFRPEELGSGNGARPALIILDIENTTDISTSVEQVRARHPEVPIAILSNDESMALGDEFHRLNRPATAPALRELMLRTTQVAA